MTSIEVGAVYIVRVKNRERSVKVTAVFPRVVDGRVLGNDFRVTVSRADVLRKAE